MYVLKCLTTIELMNMVTYKGMLLAKNSDAYKMFVGKEFKKLDEHLERLKKEAKKRGDYYE